MSGVSVSIFKSSKYFHRSKQKVNDCMLSEKLLKDLENHQRMYTESMKKNVQTFKKISILCHCPFHEGPH
jgi:hypothetical protein